jgi:nitroreductase
MKNNKTSHVDSTAFSRRDFLRGTALCGGALALSGCGSASSPNGSPGPQDSPPAAAAGAASPTPAPEFLPQIDGNVSTVALPAPRTEGGLPLMRALELRASHRTYGREEIPMQVLSDLLWAAIGINRPSGLRTAPTAVNVQDIEIYLATGKGAFRFDPRPHALQAVLADDVRALTGTQSFAGEAPVNIIYVSDYGKLGGLNYGIYGADSVAWSWTHTGFISQNVYLFCASEGLSTVVRALLDRDSLAKKIGLESTKHITMAQSVGYPG